jgi:hypothetical protein
MRLFISFILFIYFENLVSGSRPSIKGDQSHRPLRRTQLKPEQSSAWTEPTHNWHREDLNLRPKEEHTLRSQAYATKPTHAALFIY